MNGRLIALGLVAALVTSCSGGASDDRAAARFEPIDCPDDVIAAMAALRVSCGYLVVPERRDRPARPRIRVFVARIHDPSIDAPTAPIVVIGGKDVGAPVHYADDIANLPGRTGRDIVVIEPRGTGHDVPSLACPEVDAFDAGHPPGTVTTEALSEGLATATTSCLERLRSDGVDPSAFSVEEAAADVLDLVAALRLRAFDVGTYGFDSTIALAVLAADPAGLRSIYLDSPVFPGQGAMSLAVDGTISSFRALGDACREQRACRGSIGDVAELADRVVRTLDRAPLEIDVADTSIRLDGATAMRGLRELLSFAPATVPSELLALDRGDGTDLASFVASRRVSCSGFLLFCSSSDEPAAWGVVLSFDCGRGGASGGAGSVSGFDPHPYAASCDVWPDPAPSDPSAPASDVPVLVLRGGLDAYSTSPSQGWLSDLPHVAAYTFPGQWTNPLGEGAADCARSIRAAFIADPTTIPDSSCIEGMSVPPLA